VASALTSVLVAQLAAGMGALFLDLRWDLTIFAFTAAVAGLACLLFGLAPALKATSLAPAMALKAGGRGLTDARERFGLRRMLVVAQVALSLVLLLGALLFTQTLYNVLTVDVGFSQHVIHAQLTHDSLRSEVPAQQSVIRQEILSRLSGMPGVAGVALASNAPLGDSWWNEDVLNDSSSDKTLTDFTIVGDNYFETLGVAILKGRAFNAQDTLNSPPVAIVNETFARKVFPNTDPIGHLIWIEEASNHSVKKTQIVGVAHDTKYTDVRDKFDPVVHLASSQDTDPNRRVRLIIKPRAGLDGIFPEVIRRMAAMNPEIKVELKVLSKQVRDGLVRERLMAALSGAFGVLAGLLAAVGLYGVMSYTVMRRSNEIGIRLALGARRGAVLGMVLREAGILIAVGLTIGAGLGLGASNLARSLLFGLQPGDPLTIVAALALLSLIGLGASYLPARRASLLDPIRVLRDE
jgi:predicted permease